MIPLSKKAVRDLDRLNDKMEAIGRRAVGEMLETMPLPWSKATIAEASDRLVDSLVGQFFPEWNSPNREFNQAIILEIINSARHGFIHRAVHISQAFDKAAGGRA